MIAKCPNNCEGATFTVEVEVHGTAFCEVSETGEILDTIDESINDTDNPFDYKNWECSGCGEAAVFVEPPKKKKKKDK